MELIPDKRKDFVVELKKLINKSTDDCKLLAAEILYITQLFISTQISTGTKKSDIESILESTQYVPINYDKDIFDETVLKGYASAGQVYPLWYHLEFRYCVNFLNLLFNENKSARRKIFEDGWKFAEWLGAIPESSAQHGAKKIAVHPDQL